ncbi:hypothetical protein SPSIL_015250 [Sporomusa silvacetica DSM 10669]|uniref:Hint domain-containing protein n=1 Tax=Sporomusa silvacetica DSM 10669 TaxID=1123289 RepID=A0ABZ3III3_9FIRM|nr:Hint domain-containing protein [Sporomusa silvacetica]OZC21587.1 hypothetical protein SPSIL_09980 [Sporomusa silvacetica DSM 10669]
MYREVWTPVDKDTLQALGLSRVRFKGSTTKTTQSRTIPNQTATEAALESKLANYANTGITNATNYQNTANSLLGSTVNPNWSNLTSDYNNTMSGVTSGYSDLANGIIPTSYATARQQVLNDDLTGTIGNTISGLGSRGILNSSVTNNAMNDISQNASDTLAKNYTNDINTVSGILGNQASTAGNILTNNATAQQSSYYAPSQYMDYASNSASPASNLYNTMYSGRMGTGSTTTSSNDGGASTWNAIGSLGSAAIMCFVGDTLIATPDGDKYIADIHIGDKVYSLDGAIETVIEVQEPQISPNEYMLIKTATKEIRPTSTQPFLTTEGYFLPHELAGKELIGRNGNEVVVSVEGNQAREVIYDFKTTGANVYFANGFAVRGRE